MLDSQLNYSLLQAVNNVQLDGRVVKASLGTTKYCSSFLRSQPCHKPVRLKGLLCPHSNRILGVYVSA